VESQSEEDGAMNPQSTVATIFSIVFIFALGAAQAAYAAPPQDTCAALTADQVTAVLGVSVSAQAHGDLSGKDPDSHPTCWWSQPGVPAFSSKRVFLEIFGTIGNTSPLDRFSAAKTPVRGISKTPLSGVGDEAIFITSGGSNGSLDVRKGSSVFQIRVYGYPLEETKAKEKGLALQVLANL
jgi:hypothetical protein